MYTFNFEKAKKLDEKACFYTKKADLNVQNWFKNHISGLINNFLRLVDLIIIIYIKSSN